MLHPVDTADVAALDGKHVAQRVINYLHGRRQPTAGVRLTVGAPFRWVAPQILRPDDPAPACGRLLSWSDEFVRFPRVTVRQDGRVVHRRILLWPAAPGRVFRVPSALLEGISHSGGPVHLSL